MTAPVVKAMREWHSGVSGALASARESDVSLDELNASMREERRAAERMGTMVYDLVPMDPVREEITWVGPYHLEIQANEHGRVVHTEETIAIVPIDVTKLDP